MSNKINEQVEILNNLIDSRKDQVVDWIINIEIDSLLTMEDADFVKINNKLSPLSRSKRIEALIFERKCFWENEITTNRQQVIKILKPIIKEKIAENKNYNKKRFILKPWIH